MSKASTLSGKGEEKRRTGEGKRTGERRAKGAELEPSLATVLSPGACKTRAGDEGRMRGVRVQYKLSGPLPRPRVQFLENPPAKGG